MSNFVEELKKRNAAQEQRRTGDIYAECMQKGCNEDFLKAFDGRIWLFPVEQTTAFLESVKSGRNTDNVKKYLTANCNNKLSISVLEGCQSDLG